MGGQGLNTCWRDVNTIYDILSKNLVMSKKNLRWFKLEYFFRRFTDILITLIVTDLLITIFANRNFVFFPFRKVSFFLLNKSRFIRRKVLNQMTKSIVFSSIR